MSLLFASGAHTCKRLLVCFSLLCASPLCVSYQSTNKGESMPLPNNEHTLVFGVVPQQSAKKLAATWGPIIQRLSGATGQKITFATAPSIPEFEARLNNHEYDIGYMNPYHYAVYSKKADYRAIAKQKDKQIKGIVVVAKDSGFASLSDLNKGKMAFPAPLAFAATLIPNAHLKLHNIEVEQRFVKSHDSVYLGVANGFFQAGGGILRTFNASPKQVRDKLRILWKSDGYTPHAIALSPKVGEGMQKALTKALLDINDYELLNAIGFSGFTAANDAEWDSIRAMNINVTTEPSQ